MTNIELRRIVALAIPRTAVSGDEKEKVVDAVIKKSVHKIGRRTDVSFNRHIVTFSLSSGVQDYTIGTDILTDSKYATTWNMQDLWRTDVEGWQISIYGYDQYQFHAAGGTTSDAPYVATLHSKPIVLSVYPIPDSNYPCRAQVRVLVDKLSSIPEMYHDIVASYAAAFAKVVVEAGITKDGGLSIMKMSDEDMDELRLDGATGWSGGVIQVERPLDGYDNVAGYDSRRLR